MADVTTPTYSFVQPEVGGSDDTWGNKLNVNWGAVDALLAAAFSGGTPTALGKLRTEFARMATAAEAGVGAASDLFMSPATTKAAIGVFGCPVGTILLFDANVNELPPNWKVCDGTNGTPDLRNRFIVGAGLSYPQGSVGGRAVISEFPAHTHLAGSLVANVNGQHNHGVGDPGHAHSSPDGSGFLVGNTGGGTNVGFDNGGLFQAVNPRATRAATTGIWLAEGGAHEHTMRGETSVAGAASGVNYTPPYYAAVYIRRMS